jgi:hypothetical protein
MVEGKYLIAAGYTPNSNMETARKPDNMVTASQPFPSPQNITNF